MKIHVVRKGDTLYEIAKRYGVDLDVLIAANPQIKDPDVLQVGDKIRIPTKGVSPAPSKPQMPKEMEKPAPKPSPKEEKHKEGSPHFIKYLVKAGETLWHIAQRFGVALEELLAANPHIVDVDVLHVGDIIYVPKKDWHPAAPEEEPKHIPMKPVLPDAHHKLPHPPMPVHPYMHMAPPPMPVPPGKHKGMHPPKQMMPTPHHKPPCSCSPMPPMGPPPMHIFPFGHQPPGKGDCEHDGNWMPMTIWVPYTPHFWGHGFSYPMEEKYGMKKGRSLQDEEEMAD